GTGGRHHSDPPARRVYIRWRPGMVQIRPTASMRQVNFLKMPEGGQEPALGKVVGMIISREYGVKPHPFQPVEVFGIRANIGATRPLPGAFVIVKEKLQVGNADVGVANNLHEFEKVQFSKGTHAPRDHGVPHHSDAYVPTFCIIYHGPLLSVERVVCLYMRHHLTACSCCMTCCRNCMTCGTARWLACEVCE